MIHLIVRHTVADYAKWRPIYDGDAANRRAFGATGREHVFRDAANPNDITMLLEWDSAENAKKFMQSPALAETMRGAGVISAPEAHFVTEA